MERSFSKSSVLQLLEKHVESRNSAIKTLEEKALRTITLNTGVIGLVSALKLDTNSLSDTALAVLIITYAISVGIYLWGIAPRDVPSHPLNPTWKEAQRVLEKNDEEYLDWLIGSYTEVIEKLKELNKWKAGWVKLQFIIMALFFGMVAGIPLI